VETSCHGDNWTSTGADSWNKEDEEEEIKNKEELSSKY